MLYSADEEEFNDEGVFIHLFLFSEYGQPPLLAPVFISEQEADIPSTSDKTSCITAQVTAYAYC